MVFRGADSYMAQAKECESQADYERAVAAYLKVNKPLTQNEQMMERAWTKVHKILLCISLPSNGIVKYRVVSHSHL